MVFFQHILVVYQHVHVDLDILNVFRQLKMTSNPSSATNDLTNANRMPIRFRNVHIANILQINALGPRRRDHQQLNDFSHEIRLVGFKGCAFIENILQFLLERWIRYGPNVPIVYVADHFFHFRTFCPRIKGIKLTTPLYLFKRRHFLIIGIFNI